MSGAEVTTSLERAHPRPVERSSTIGWPRITLVTPVYNGEDYLEETIRSVVDQGYPNLDYFIVDDGSTDGTAEIVKKYERHLTGWFTQPNQGMYTALNTGFARTSGEIMGWINANDKLHMNGLFVVGSIFRDLPDVEWITGRRTVFSEDGMPVLVSDVDRWSRYRFLAGANRTIQQESTFWRRTLWKKAGGYIDVSGRYGHVSDFELWVRFFRHAPVYPVDALIGGWRAHSDSGFSRHMEECYRIYDQIVDEELNRLPWAKWLKILPRIRRTLEPIPIIRGVWRRIVMNSLYFMPAPDWPPVIEYQWKKWGFRHRT